MSRVTIPSQAVHKSENNEYDDNDHDCDDHPDHHDDNCQNIK